MKRPLGSLLLSLPVALVLAAPAAQAQSSSGTQSGRFPGLFGLFRDDQGQEEDIRQAQVQQSQIGQSRIEAESLPPPGLAQPNGVVPQALGPANSAPSGYSQPNNGQPMPLPQGPIGHQFGNEPPRTQTSVQPAIERPPAGLGGPSAAPAPLAPNTVMTLPPEDQPEQGQPKELPANLKKQLVDFQTKEPAGTIIVDTPNTYLYLVLGGGKAMRYGIGVGREGFTWNGTERISRMREWPDWFPPSEMIERQPYLPRMMAGGPGNPLGARALYLGNTLYRIHGTNQPSTIGQTVSSGCIRLLNEDIEDLFSRVQVGTRVVVWPGNPATVANAAGSTPVSTGAPASNGAPAPINPPVMSRPGTPVR
ncbi:L,D-transpeptidase [Undibacter mobilis]|uniref:L,D-transpeptidase n=1 Tax=Undibacter mobilis TaxID=2292256 RepID=A0A371B8G7_9BRAD|nr:L,D-transpeptidase [Undibacter mobilis]RDV03723.1 L,D-transpeptidase [Undibacter mobilis]